MQNEPFQTEYGRYPKPNPKDVITIRKDADLLTEIVAHIIKEAGLSGRMIRALENLRSNSSELGEKRLSELDQFLALLRP